MDKLTHQPSFTARRRISRRRLLLQAAALATLPAGALFYARNYEPFWPRFPEVSIAIKGLPKSLEGFRIAQITDMHAGHVPWEYLEGVMKRVNQLNPDRVVFTGDLIHHDASAIDGIAELIRSLSAPVVVSFGNHEYSPYRGDDEPYLIELPQLVEDAVTAAGAKVLRNDAIPIEEADGRLWLVGLDDLWFGEFDPQRAFSKVAKNEPVIALSHNPDTAQMLDPYHPDLILSGHTHGGQIRLPYYGAIRLNVAQPEFDMGHFQLPNSQLFVSTGVGYIMRLRFLCRPEVPILRLIAAQA